MFGLESRHKDERSVEVFSPDLNSRVFWRDKPSSVLRTPQQRCETGARIEPGPTQPIDRAISTHQRCCLAVADQGIVFDPPRRCSEIGSWIFLHRITRDFVIQLVKWNAYGRVCWRSIGFRRSAQRCLSAGAYIKGYS